MIGRPFVQTDTPRLDPRGRPEAEAEARKRALMAAADAALAASGTVSLELAAAGAAVELDGVVIGTAPGVFQIRPGVHEIRVTREGYATWEKSIALADGQVLDVPMELSGSGIARKGELEAQDIAREQSAADAQATTTIAGGDGSRQPLLFSNHVSQEGDHIQERGLATGVGADQHLKWAEMLSHIA